jgi:hypothetical protein
MKTTECIEHWTLIELDSQDQFNVRCFPRKARVNYIAVHAGHFELTGVIEHLGGTGSTQRRVGRNFRSTEKVSGMPYDVALMVQQCTEALR